MRGLLCVAFLLGWPVFMWFSSTFVLSFVLWGNYFVVGLQEWHMLARLMFVIFWLIGMLFFIGFLTDNESEDY